MKFYKHKFFAFGSQDIHQRNVEWFEYDIYIQGMYPRTIWLRFFFFIYSVIALSSVMNKNSKYFGAVTTTIEICEILVEARGEVKNRFPAMKYTERLY